MKVALISFTDRGADTCSRIEAGLKTDGHQCGAFGKEPFAGQAGIMTLSDSLDEWTKAAFAAYDALVFISAIGIAVRAIAPYVRDKTADPAVVVVDELGKYAISLLSGHLGGANDLAREIADIIGAEPVITTATDLNQRFAVDEWAKKNRLVISDMKLAKEISAALLRGEIVGVSSEAPIGGTLPEGLRYFPEEEISAGKQESTGINRTGHGLRIGFRISIYEKQNPFEKTLHLIPRTVTVGMGCRKGVSPEAVTVLLDKVLKEHKLSVRSIEKICSVDLKKEEPALKQLADQMGVPLEVFSAEELEQLAGEFSSSEFVNRITGVDNICERAAVLGSRGELTVRKQALNGVTVAIAVREEGYTWMQQSGREG